MLSIHDKRKLITSRDDMSGTLKISIFVNSWKRFELFESNTKFASIKTLYFEMTLF